MLKLSPEAMSYIEQGGRISPEATIHFQVPETYTEEDLLVSVGQLTTNMSAEGGYAIANTTITLKNQSYYFSRKFAKELPNNKLVEVFFIVGDERIQVFRGITNKDWKLTPSLLTLNVNA
jgi:hypothetical protein